MKKILILLIICLMFVPIVYAENTKEIQFIYINGSNNNDKKMKDWFFKGIKKMHPNMYNAFNSSIFIQEHLLNNGEYTLSQNEQTFFWGDKSKVEIESLNSDLDVAQIFSPRIAQMVRKLLAHCLHDAIWVSHYRNMHPIIEDLHTQIMENHKNNKSVVLFGYSAGAFVTYEYIFNKLADISLEDYFSRVKVEDKTRELIKKHPMQDTCIDALVKSQVSIYNVEKRLMPNPNEDILRKGYLELDKYTCQYCTPKGAVKGIVNFASPFILFYSDVSNPEYPLTYFNKLLYKYLIENDVFWMTVNYAEDPLGYPTAENITYSELKDKLMINIDKGHGFLYGESRIKNRTTFIGAHTSYWNTSKKFSREVAKAYEKGYNLYNK